MIKLLYYCNLHFFIISLIMIMYKTSGKIVCVMVLELYLLLFSCPAFFDKVSYNFIFHLLNGSNFIIS